MEGYSKLKCSSAEELRGCGLAAAFSPLPTAHCPLS